MAQHTNSSTTLTGRTAVVTGGGRGIGRALALALARAGANVVISSRTEANLVATLEEIEAVGAEGLSVVADARTPQGASIPVAAAVDRFGGVDILVNNIGGRVEGDHDPFTGDVAMVEKEVELNLLTGWWATHAALPHMQHQRYGRIINIGSGAARSSGSRIGYTVAKHGLIGLTRAVAASAAPFGITVNCVSPGWTNTHDWNSAAQAAGLTTEAYLDRARSQNLQCRIIEPEELGHMVVLLASEHGGAAITGQEIGVDGGHKV